MKAVMIDTREPDWAKSLKFGGLPVALQLLDAGDYWLVADDDTLIVVERKTPADFCQTMASDRLFPQAVGLAEMRKAGAWPYFMITGAITCGRDGKAVLDGKETGFEYRAIMGAILTLQELGCMVTFCAGDTDLENALTSLAKRDHKKVTPILPMREGKILGYAAAFLCGLPGIGVERAQSILAETGTAAWALVCLTDKDSNLKGVGRGMKNNIRAVLGLETNQQLGIEADDELNESIKVLALGQQ